MLNQPPRDRALKATDVVRRDSLAVRKDPVAVFHPTPNHSLLTPPVKSKNVNRKS